MAQFGDVLAGDVLAFEEVEDEPAPAASALSNLSGSQLLTQRNGVNDIAGAFLLVLQR